MSKGRKKQTYGFLHGSAISAYIHASKPTKLEDFTIQVSQNFKFLQLTSKVSMNLYNQEIISPISSPQVFPTLTHSHTHNLIRNENYNKNSL